MPSIPELLRPPPHRGPLIAAGAVLLTVGIALTEQRLGSRLADGVQLLILAGAAAAILALGLQAPGEGGRPPAYQSVLLVCGLLLVYPALLRLAAVSGADLHDLQPGTLVWTSLVMAAASARVATYRGSAVCALIAAVAGGVAGLAALDWIFAPASFAPARWLLLVLALGLVLVSLVLRADHPRHAELLVDAAALAILAIAAQALVRVLVAAVLPFAGSPDQPLPGFWELVVLVAGCGLVAYGAVDRAPGPAWLGVANLATFVLAVSQGEATMRWWPIVLLVLGVATMGAGLRPRRPLPPEPRGYRTGEQPVAARASEPRA